MSATIWIVSVKESIAAFTLSRASNYPDMIIGYDSDGIRTCVPLSSVALFQFIDEQPARGK